MPRMLKNAMCALALVSAGAMALENGDTDGYDSAHDGNDSGSVRPGHRRRGRRADGGVMASDGGNGGAMGGGMQPTPAKAAPSSNTDTDTDTDTDDNGGSRRRSRRKNNAHVAAPLATTALALSAVLLF